MDSLWDQLRERAGSLLEPFEDIWGLYQGLDPEQQRAVMLLAPLAVLGLIAWGMYQTHGDRVVIVLPAMLLRYSLLLLALPVVLAGMVAGRGWGMPELLTRDWTAEPDPDRPEIPMKEVNPMKLPGKLYTRR
jgi:hypothetical protein